MSVNLPKEKQVCVLYGELYRLIQSDEYDRIIKQCNKILQLAPKESKAIHCKVVCLLKLDRIDECMSLLNKNAELCSELHFEKAYCQYRLNDPESAIGTIEKASLLTDQLMELKAQVLYKLARHKEAYALYREIVREVIDDYDDERQTNISAILAHVPLPEGHSEPDAGTYEILFNKAFKHIGRQEYAEAERTLAASERLCLSSCEDEGYSDEETQQELAFIRVQLAYCYQMQGRAKAAQQLYTSLIKMRLEDAALTAVASNNIVAINKDQNLFDSKKKMKVALQECNRHKLNHQQAKTVHLNNCLLLYHLNQSESCLRCCDSVAAMWPEDKAAATVIRALAACRDGRTDEAVTMLATLSDSQPQSRLLLQLTAAQILLDAGRVAAACAALQALGDQHRYRPGVVGMLVSLNVALSNQPGAASVFEDTVAWYRQYRGAHADVGRMWQQAADFHMKHGNPSVAASCLEELLRTSPGDKRIIAKLIMAYVQCEPAKAEKLSAQLPSLDNLTGSLREEDIETSTMLHGFARQPRPKTDLSPGTPRSDADGRRKRKKRRGKGQLPPGVYLDPERWLPRYERVGYKKKRDRRNKDTIKGSQGSASCLNDSFDFSNKSAEVAAQPDRDSPELLKSSVSAKKQSQKKRKKGSRK